MNIKITETKQGFNVKEENEEITLKSKWDKNGNLISFTVHKMTEIFTLEDITEKIEKIHRPLVDKKIRRKECCTTDI